MDAKKINDCIMNFIKNGKPNIPLSINERSLQIFGDEKFLASSECKKLLNKHGISMGIFNVYKTPEPFIYFKYSDEPKTALIIENKDTWYTMRKLLLKGNRICGIPIDVLIYGEGRKIQNSFQYMEVEDTNEIHGVETFYYFGDIDSSGIDIMYKLIKEYSGYHIVPFVPGYEYLYEKREYGRVKDLKLAVSITYKELALLKFLGDKALDDIYTLCNHNYIIPQELLNYNVLTEKAS